MAVSKGFSQFMVVALLFGLAVAQSPTGAPSPSPSLLFNPPTRSPSSSPSPAPTNHTAPSPATSSPSPSPTPAVFSPPSLPPSDSAPSLAPSVAVPPSTDAAPAPSPHNVAVFNKAGFSATSIAVLLAVAMVA